MSASLGCLSASHGQSGQAVLYEGNEGVKGELTVEFTDQPDLGGGSLKMYLYELHCHSNVGSRCGQWSPEELVESYAARGYSGVVITEHFMNGNSSVDRDLPWNQQVEQYCAAYDRARQAGEKYGLDVFFAFEYTCNTYYGQPVGPMNSKDSIFGCDFLIYGLDKKWLLSKNESILHLAVNDFLKMVKDEGGTVIQAHPFRLEKAYMDHISLFPDYTDGVEVLNGNPNTVGRPNRLALAYAEEYGFFQTAGTDAHGECKQYAVTTLYKKATDIQDLIAELKARRCKLEMIQSG